MPEASRDDSAMQRERLHRDMREALHSVDDSDRSLVAMLTGVRPDEIDAIGGVRDEETARMCKVMSRLGGTDRARVALLTGPSPERIDELGGTGE